MQVQQTHGGDNIALLHDLSQIILTGGAGEDVAVDEDLGLITLLVLHHELGNALAVGGENHIHDFAFNLQQLAAVVGVVHSILGGNLFGLDHILCLIQNLDGHNLDFDIPLVSIGVAGDANLGALFQTGFGVGEDGDAAGLILDVDGIEEGGVGVGGAGGDITLDDEDMAHLGAGGSTNLSDGSNHLAAAGQTQNVLKNGTVCVGQIPDVIQLCLHLKVGEEHAAGGEDRAAEAGILCSQEAGLTLGNATDAVIVGVDGVGGIEAFHQPGALAGVHGTAGILAVDLAMDDACAPLRIHIEILGIQTVGLAPVGNFVIGLVVVDGHGGADGREQFVQLRCGMALSAEGCGFILVVSQTADQNGTAVAHILGNHCDEIVLEGLGNVLAGVGGAGLLGGRGNNQQTALSQHFSRDGIGLHMDLDALGCRDDGHIVHIAAVVAVDIVVEVGTVHDHLAGDGLGHDGNFQILGVGLLDAVQRALQSSGDGVDAVSGEGIAEGGGGGALLANGSNAGFGVDDLSGSLVGVDQRLNQQIGAFVVEQLSGEGLLLTGDGQSGLGLQPGDAHSLHLAHPNGSGDRNVAVGLGDADVVVVVVSGNGQSDGAGGGRQIL